MITLVSYIFSILEYKGCGIHMQQQTTISLTSYHVLINTQLKKKNPNFPDDSCTDYTS